jgi:hypothetical protein
MKKPLKFIKSQKMMKIASRDENIGIDEDAKYWDDEIYSYDESEEFILK